MKRRFIFLILINLAGNALFAQSSIGSKGLLLLKADARAVMAQPVISAEYFLSEKISVEAGGGYFRTGQKMYGGDLCDGFSYVFFSVGPSRGFDLFADVKYYFPRGFYIGLGYLYRYSYFTNKKMSVELDEYKYQYYRQSELAYSNMARLTVGFNYKISKNIAGNPYIALMIGASDLKVTIDTGGATTYTNYSPVQFPEHHHFIHPTCIFQLGFRFCFDVPAKAKKTKSIQIPTGI